MAKKIPTVAPATLPALPPNPPAPQGHQCSPTCRHTCAEMGGLTAKKKPCGRLTGEGIPGVVPGQYGRKCLQHDDQGQLPASLVGPLAMLEPRQRAFVEAFCGESRFNGTQAARTAGYNGTDEVLASMASSLLRNPKVRTAVQIWMNAHSMNAAELTALIADMATVNPGPFVKLVKGKLVWHVTKKAWEAHKHWVKGFEIDPLTGRTKLLLHDARDAQRDLAKILKLYNDTTVNVFLFQNMPDDELLRVLEQARLETAHAQIAVPTTATPVEA